MEHGTSAGRFIFEFDGVAAVRASEVTGIGVMHEEFEFYESNRPNPHIGRGHYKCDKLKVKHAHALNSTGREVFQWFRQCVKEGNVERRSGRLIVLDEDGALSLANFSPQGAKVLSRVSLLQNNAWTVPSLAGTRLYLRDRRSMMALDLR